MTKLKPLFASHTILCLRASQVWSKLHRMSSFSQNARGNSTWQSFSTRVSDSASGMLGSLTDTTNRYVPVNTSPFAANSSEPEPEWFELTLLQVRFFARLGALHYFRTLQSVLELIGTFSKDITVFFSTLNTRCYSDGLVLPSALLLGLSCFRW